MKPLPPHGVRAHLAITTELIRLTLGGRGPARPELLRPILNDRTQHRTSRRKPRRKK